MIRKRLGDEFPMFDAYGDRPAFLSAEEAVVATTAERIRGVWPFLMRRVLDFQAKLKPRERVNFDPEDTLAALYVAIAERDGKWQGQCILNRVFSGRYAMKFRAIC